MPPILRNLYEIFYPIIKDGCGWSTCTPINKDTEIIGDGPYRILLEKRMFQTPVTIIIRVGGNEKKAYIKNATGREIFTAIQKETDGRYFAYKGLQQQFTPKQYLAKLSKEVILHDLLWNLGNEVSEAIVRDNYSDKVPDTPANLNYVPFNEVVNIRVEEEVVVAGAGATLGEILDKINAVYNKAFEAELEGDPERELWFEGLEIDGPNDCRVLWGT
ncbi:hypothetical protein V491_09269 [Pseudogymnoascus sp. VKM F-3775]|nr:hypothetical protein V491_09269 [Pseudogymnoascus sp. VKM F-3775]